MKEGRAGLSPKKNGPPGDIVHGTFLMLANAFESFFRISQLNGTIKDSCRYVLDKKVKACLGKESPVSCKLLD